MSSVIGPRLAAMLGAAFAVLLFLGVASLNIPHSVSDQEMIDWWSDGANRDTAIISMYMVAFSAIALLLFLGHMRERLNGDGGTAGNAMFAVGIGACSLLLASAALRATIATGVKNDEPLPGVDMLRYVPQLSRNLVEMSLVTMAASLVLLFLATRRTSAFPAWFGYVSLATAVLLFAGTPFIGPFMIPVLLLWAIAGSVVTWRSGAVAATGRLRQSALPS